MRGLVVSPYRPLLPGQYTHGAYQRFDMFVRALAQTVKELEFLHFLSPQLAASLPEPAKLNELQSARWGVPCTVAVIERAWRHETAWSHYGAGIFSIIAQPEYYALCGDAQVAALKSCLERAPALIFVSTLAAMCPFLRLNRQLPTTFLDFDNLDHRVLLRSIFDPPFRPGKFLYLLQMPALVAAARRAARLATNAFVCSDLDRAYAQRWTLGSQIIAVPNAVTMPAETPAIASEQTLLFLGYFGYGPNSDAAERLVTAIFPRIRQQLPTARLIIAGQAPENIRSYASHSQWVEFTGFVDDLPALYRRSRVICCPIINGGGTRLKLIEAAGYAKPIVSTAVGAEGLDLEDGREIFIRNDDQALAEACVKLLSDEHLCAKIGGAARRKAQQLYDVGKVRERISELVREVLAHSDNQRGER